MEEKEKELEERRQESRETEIPKETIPEETEPQVSVFETIDISDLSDLGSRTIVEDNIIPDEESEDKDFTIQNFNFMGKILIGVLDGIVVLGAWIYTKNYVDVKYKDIQAIVGLKETEKTELGRLLGRILYKYNLIITEEIMFVISLVRIYSINKFPVLMQFINENKSERTTKKQQKQKREKKKEKIKVKDVLEEIKQE